MEDKEKHEIFTAEKLKAENVCFQMTEMMMKCWFSVDG